MDSFWLIIVGLVAGILAFLRMKWTARRQAPPVSPTTARPSLTPEAISEIDQLVAQNLRIKAIKALREHTRLSLQDAKTLIDQWTPGTLSTSSAQPIPTPHVLPATIASQIDDLVTAGKEIEAIKLLREHTGSGLRDAKDGIDRWVPGKSHR